jgi:hypothetical protein
MLAARGAGIGMGIALAILSFVQNAAVDCAIDGEKSWKITVSLLDWARAGGPAEAATSIAAAASVAVSSRRYALRVISTPSSSRVERPNRSQSDA